MESINVLCPIEIATTICVDEFALRKGHHYANSDLNADSILAIVPHRNQDPITAVLQKTTSPIRAVNSDFCSSDGEPKAS